MTGITNLDRARRALLTRHPFFAVTLSQLSISVTEAVPRAAVDTNGTILLNPKFIDETPTPQLAAVLAHETMHVLRGDFLRGAKADRHMWNIASDLIINNLLERHSEPLLKLPDDVVRLTDRTYDDLVAKLKAKGTLPADYDHRTEWDNARTPTERIYALLKEALEGEDQDGAGQPHDELTDGGQSGDPSGISSDGKQAGKPTPHPLTPDRIKRIANIAAQAAKRAQKQAGDLPGWLDDFVDQLNDPYVNWRAVLRDFVTSKSGADWSWARPHIPTLTATGCIAPSLNPTPSTGNIFVLLDSSASVKDSLLAQFWAEIRALKAEFNTTVHVGHFTTQLDKVETYDQHDAPDAIVPTQRYHGGTDTSEAMRQAIKWCGENGVQPDCWLVLSDFYSPTPSAAEFDAQCGGKTLWCYTPQHGDIPSWGQAVEVAPLADNN